MYVDHLLRGGEKKKEKKKKEKEKKRDHLLSHSPSLLDINFPIRP